MRLGWCCALTLCAAPLLGQQTTCADAGDDPGPPVLRRGAERAPRKLRCLEPQATHTPIPDPAATSQAGPPDPPLDLMDRVRLKESQYWDQLPNFVCEQTIRRHEGRKRNNRDRWKLEDTIITEVAMVDGREEYQKATRNGKPVDWNQTKETGTFSAGEFGRALHSLISTAEFTPAGTVQLDGRDMELFRYIVRRDRSRWRLEYGGKHLNPSYRGRVWVDPELEMIVRIEMETVGIDREFPISHAETTLDYSLVRIDEQEFLLPVKAANLACLAMENICTRNDIEFRKYRRFGAESTIVTTDSTVTFEGAGGGKK